MTRSLLLEGSHSLHQHSSQMEGHLVGGNGPKLKDQTLRYDERTR
jgi:hypothetical protein